MTAIIIIAGYSDPGTQEIYGIEFERDQYTGTWRVQFAVTSRN